MLLSVERPNCGSLCLLMTKGHAAALNGLVQAVLPASVWNMCKRIMEVPQELGRSCCFLGNIPDGDTGLPTPGLGGLLVRQGANLTSASEVSPSEGNEVRRDGQQEVVAPHSTDEAGELVPLDPVEGRQNRKGCLMLDPGSGNTSEALNLEARINDTAQDSIPGMQRCCMANPLSEEPYALMWARTGLWEPWVRNHPGPPGPPSARRCSPPQR